MKIRNLMVSLVLITILTLCMFHGIVAAVPVSKLTSDTHSSDAGDVDRTKQTYILARFCFFAPTFSGEATTLIIGVGQPIHIKGVLSYDIPPTNFTDHAHGIPYKTLNVQSLNSDGETWSTIGTNGTFESGAFDVALIPPATGDYTYRITYGGDSQYAPAVSNKLTVTVTNVMIS